MEKKRFASNIFFIGLLSFFGGISQDMFLPILPLYLANVLHFDKAFIGLLEGVVNSSVSIFRIAAGFLADKFRSNKLWISLGYVTSLISRVFLAIISIGPGILVLRFFDGLGKGIKDPPKDTLIAGSAYVEERGKSFGVVRMLDTFGSVVGPLILFVLLYLLRNNDLKYHYIFLLCAIPLAVTLFISVVKVKEIPAPQGTKPLDNSLGASKLRGKLSAEFFIFLGIMLLFAFGNFPVAFLLLRAHDVGVTLLEIPLIYALYNFLYASVSVPLGSLSDKIGREKVIFLGFLSFAFVYLGFAFASQAFEIWVLFALYGLYFATTEGVAKAFVADLIPVEFRGRAYGIYNSLIGFVALPSSVFAGFLWDRYNSMVPFLVGGGIALGASLLIVIFEKFFHSHQIKNI